MEPVGVTLKAAPEQVVRLILFTLAFGKTDTVTVKLA
jgi:hypothetical protein